MTSGFAPVAAPIASALSGLAVLLGAAVDGLDPVDAGVLVGGVAEEGVVAPAAPAGDTEGVAGAAGAGAAPPHAGIADTARAKTRTQRTTDLMVSPLSAGNARAMLQLQHRPDARISGVIMA